MIRSYLLMKSLMDNFIFCAVCSNSKSYLGPYLSHKYTFVTYYKNWFIQLFLAVLDMFSSIQILMFSPHLLTSFMMMLSLSQKNSNQLFLPYMSLVGCRIASQVNKLFCF